MTDTTLAITPLDFEPRTLPQAMQLADMLSKSALVPDAIRGKPADILLIIMKGRELGLTVNQAFTHLNVIKGKVGMSADMMVALCRTRCPDFVRFECLETTPLKATFEAERKGQKPERLTFTMEDAQRAGLVSDGGMYRKYPAQMLRARCQSALARLLFQDVVAGLYDPDELRAPSQREQAEPPAPITPVITVEPIPEEPAPMEAAFDAHTGEVINGEAEGEDVLQAVWQKKVQAETTRAGMMKVITQAPAPLRQSLGQLLKGVR